jgi:hypothetical protein
MVRKHFPNVRLIANERNLGFAAAANQGIRRSQGRYILLLNPDILNHPASMDGLVQTFDRLSNAGALAPKLLGADGRIQSGYFRKYPSLGQVFFFHTFLTPFSEKSPLLIQKYFDDVRSDSVSVYPVTQIPGGCIMVPRAIIDTVGLLDEQFFLFYEDVDWCLRIRSSGKILYVQPEYSMTHLGARSYGQSDRIWMKARFALSLNMFVDKHGTFLERILTKCITFLNSLVIVILRKIQMSVITGSQRERIANSLLSHKLFLISFLGHYYPRLFASTVKRLSPEKWR